MIELRGKYNSANVYTDNIETEAISQIIELCNQEFVKDSKIRIMPDTHAGKGCTIGTTMTIQDKLVPNLVGVDIGCGMETIKLKDKHIEFQKLDKIIKQHVPSGFDVRSKKHELAKNLRIDQLRCAKKVNLNRAYLSCGSLGGGNHYIEVDKDQNGFLYLVIHSGARNLGKEVAEYYQKIAIEKLNGLNSQKQELIEKLKKEGRQKDIELELDKIKIQVVNKSLAYLTGQDFDDYLHDMKITQEFAMWNRKTMADVIVREMGFKVIEQFSTIHNYIDTSRMILRKGAISAYEDEKVLIPINMRDGAIIAIGKGNPDWNYSAPHGAGRLMSRSKAKESIAMSDYKESMKGIWSTSVTNSTIDESPMAYKPIEEILDNIGDTVDVMEIIKPVYNFKSS